MNQKKTIKEFIPVAEPDLSGNEKKYLIECINSGWVSSRGSFVQKLEEGFSEYLGVKYTAAVSSGTAGLHLALLALGVGVGDEVIVPTFTFIATVNAVIYVGARPVFIDSEPETGNLDTSKLEELITPKTKAVIPVHLYGHPVDMRPLLKITRKHKIAVIEDAAEAHGAKYYGRMVGTFGDIAVFSLFANKIITSGEGGLVCTNSKKLNEKIRMLRDQGIESSLRQKYKYWHSIIGYNYGMSNLQAAVAYAQLERIDLFLKKKRQVANWYRKYLSRDSGLEFSKEMTWAESSYWMCSIILSKDLKSYRDQFIDLLREEGIETRPFFYPIHILPPYNHKIKLDIASDLTKRGINLPSSTTLTETKVKSICKIVNQLVEKYSKNG